MIQWFNDSIIQMSNDSINLMIELIQIIQWFNDSMIQWFNDLKWFNDSMIQWFKWFNDSMIQWFKWVMIQMSNDSNVSMI